MIESTPNEHKLHPISQKLLIKASRYRSKEFLQEKSGHLINAICFNLVNETYGIELDQLQEVLKAKSIGPVPGSADYLRGIINLRGSLVTVIDLKKRMGLDHSQITQHSRVIIVKFESRLIGLLVDRVKEIIRLKQSDFIESEIGLSRVDNKFIRKIGKTSDQVIIFPDLKAVFQLSV